MAATQNNSQIAVSTPLGEDVLLLQSVSIDEEMGRLFTMQLDVLSADNIKFEDLLGQRLTVRVDVTGDQKRFFNGYVGAISQAPDQGYFMHYHVTVYPWLWFLTRTADCRIFQNQTVPEIIKQVFQDCPHSQFEDKLTGTYRKWEYCVQYRETDFNFVSRLMEQEGIYYYFTHQDGRHTLVLADDGSAHETIEGFKTIEYHRDPHNYSASEGQTINDWHLKKQLLPGVYALNDYDFVRPNAKLEVDCSIVPGHEYADQEIYDYPGEYVESGDGSHYVRARIQELHAQYEEVSGRSRVRGLCAGGLFCLEGYPRDDQNREYLVTSVRHSISVDDYHSGSKGGNPADYTNNFTVIVSKTPFRPARITPKPIVQGPQTAVVTGPGGEEIYTDEHGRVKLKFHWDRHNKKDENSSCWVRVSQLWAGKNWGGIHIPRIGQEVIVEFLEGDPDRPIVTGRVYNGEQVPPYALPANKTQSGIKSRSSQGGSGANFNEIRMEDKKGEEQLYIHAEKNQDNVVENDETTMVGHDRTEDVGHDETIHIGNNRTETVDVDETITIGNNRTETVVANESITVGANRTRSVGGSESVTVAMQRTHMIGINETIGIGAAQEIGIGAFQAVAIGAYQTVDIGANQSINVGANQDTNVGSNQSIAVGGNQSESVSGNVSVSVDGNRGTSIKGDDSLKVGKNLVIDAGDSVTIKTGSASITMKKDGTIVIKGKDITVEGSGKIDAKASKNIVMKGQKILQN
jgi:type VI secretion system secreted protein VgrG